MTYETDNDIIKDFCATKSEKSSTAFVRKHQNFVFSTALRYLQSYEDADDAAQEVFIKALQNLHKFRGDSNIKTWLYRITVNVCTNMKRKKKIFSYFSDYDSEEFFSIPTDEASPLEKIQDSEFKENFLKEMNKLPPKQREVFALRYYEDLTYEEISKMLGTTVGGLKANYFQAVKKLASALKS